MNPTLVVVPDTGTVVPQIEDGLGLYSDLVGSLASDTKPIVAGVWDVTDRTGPTETFQAEWDEAKYFVHGEAHVRDETTGVTHKLKPGTMLWIPKGSKSSLVYSKGCSAIYFEQRPGDGKWLTGRASDTNSPEAEKLAKLIDKFVTANPQSRQAFERAQTILPGGNTRSVLYSDPFPLFIESGQGCQVTTVDGNQYIDFLSDFSAGFYGHSHPVLTEAVIRAASNGFSLGGVTRKEADLGDHIKSRFASIDKVRFCNSGTEANMFAVGVAAAFTKRKKVLVFDNGYHGGTLSFHTRTNAINLPHDFVYGQYNSIEATRPQVTQELAAILVEPMQSAGGMIPATKEFLQFLRAAADVTGAVLIFDEVVTSRMDMNGMQGLYGITPDMTTLGKYLGGGLPFGAFGGKSDIMALFEPGQSLSHSGTFNNNVFTMTAALAATSLVTKEVIDRLNGLGDMLRDKANKICSDAGFHVVKLTGFGSAVGIHFSGPNSVLLRDCFFFHMLSRGILFGRRGFVSLNMAHDDVHIENFLQAFDDFVLEYK